MTSYYHNEILFSEIYLEEITRQPEKLEALASLTTLVEYRDYANTSSLQAWRDSFIREVFYVLGFEVKPGNDHLIQLFALGSAGEDSKPLSLCYMVLPEENLDNTTIGRNWAEKIIRALRENNLQWGLLTNGKQWRIYHQDEPTPYETYLEIDLEAILKEKAKEAYQIFHKFMKAENFSVQEDGKCQFDRFKKESQDKIDYIEKELAKALKQREGEKGKGVLQDLCLGYVAELRRRKEGDLDDEVLRRKIYHGAMLYMFRLLFLLYADARGLLSDENHAQLAKVLTASQPEKLIENGQQRSTSLWEDLETIFVDIDQTYNGGLFSPQESEFTLFLSETPIANAYLANVVFNLTTYHEKNGEEKPISYRDMGVRHLGTLYEGLLEHKLFIAEEDTEVKVSKGKIQFIPASQGGKLVVGHYIKDGEVYFAGDPSERKSTGSYYTPEYIVDYIVRNTVGEKLKELKVAFLQEQRPTLEAYNRAVEEDERRALAVLLEENALTFVREKVLELSVLDPAMGSGHFLVNATNMISNFITELLNELTIEGGLESGTGYWRRWVVENCIYGVDINPLAVELAKLSLWILSMTKNQPLSFLNHHFKCGNSLVGANLEEIGNYQFSLIDEKPFQLSIFENDPALKSAINEAIHKIHNISSKSSITLDDINEKKTRLDEIDQVLKSYKVICDIHTSMFFSSQVTESQYTQVFKEMDFPLAHSVNVANHYFHWELEFPDLLTKKKGVDCIVGNPPYVFVESETYYKNKYSTESTKNLFCYFSELSMSLVTQEGYVSFIVPLTGFSVPQMVPFQEILLDQSSVLKLVNFSWRPAKVFEAANLPVTIFIAKKKHSTNNTKLNLFTTNYLRWRSNETPIDRIKFIESTKYLSICPGYFPKIGNSIEIEILEKMITNRPLGNFIDRASKGDSGFYYRSKGGLYFKIFTDFSSGSTNELTITTGDSRNNSLLIAVLSSSLFFWFYDCFSSCRVLNFDNIASFPFDYQSIQGEIEEELLSLSRNLMDDIKRNAEIKTRVYQGFGKKQAYTIYMRKSKNIIDEIDKNLGKHYRFSDNELSYIINYASEFRANIMESDDD